MINSDHVYTFLITYSGIFIAKRIIFNPSAYIVDVSTACAK